MSDWQVGDLAMFVGGTQKVPGRVYAAKEKRGRIRRVEGVVHQRHQTGLVLEGIRSDHPAGAWDAIQWRKVRPDEHEACEPEFVTLLKRTKRTVRA